jgi:homogentisate 1,2-dioxygenase
LRDYFTKNAIIDEMIFIHKGKGKLRTMMEISCLNMVIIFIIPRGVIYQIDFETAVKQIAVCRICAFYTPKRYKKRIGQHLEHLHFCERDFILPTELETDEKGRFFL